MESPRPVFVVPSLNSFRRCVKAALASTSRARVNSTFSDTPPQTPSPVFAKRVAALRREDDVPRLINPAAPFKLLRMTPRPSTRPAACPVTPARSQLAKASVSAAVTPDVRSGQPRTLGTSVRPAASASVPRPSQLKRLRAAAPKEKVVCQLPTPPPTPPLAGHPHTRSMLSRKENAQSAHIAVITERKGSLLSPAPPNLKTPKAVHREEGRGSTGPNSAMRSTRRTLVRKPALQALRDSTRPNLPAKKAPVAPSQSCATKNSNTSVRRPALFLKSPRKNEVVAVTIRNIESQVQGRIFPAATTVVAEAVSIPLEDATVKKPGDAEAQVPASIFPAATVVTAEAVSMPLADATKENPTKNATISAPTTNEDSHHASPKTRAAICTILEHPSTDPSSMTIATPVAHVQANTEFAAVAVQNASRPDDSEKTGALESTSKTCEVGKIAPGKHTPPGGATIATSSVSTNGFAKTELEKRDDELTTRANAQPVVEVGSSIQARIAAMFSAAGVKQPAADVRTGVRVCRFRTPELLESDKASRDARIQREVEALRSLQRVGSGTKIIANTRAFGGDGPANAPSMKDGSLSLQSVHVLERVKREQMKGASK